MRVVFWSLLAVATALYLVIVLWSLPQIATAAGGRVPFDMRPTGYGAAEARDFLAALSPEGRAFYLGTQHLLDLFYPAVIGLTFAAGFALLYARPWIWLLLALSAGVTLFDWGENLYVRRMLAAGPDGVSDSTIATASALTLAKSVCTTLAGVALLAGALVALARRIQRPV